MVKATIIKIERKISKSRYGGHYYLVCFKDDNGRSYFTYVYPKMRNFARWSKAMREGTTLKNLTLKSGRLIDADSRFLVVKG